VTDELGRRTQGGDSLHTSRLPLRGSWAKSLTSLTRLTKIEGSMPALITKEGVPTDSPISAERRHALKEEIYRDIHQLQVKVQLLEEREKMGKK